MSASGPAVDEATLEELVEDARRLATGGARRILGLTGAPGAGKSALAEALVAALAPDALLVPMDGFHLAQAELVRLGRQDRKGAPDTFDAAGYVALLRRLREPAEALVYAPQFRRELEEPIAGAIAVPRRAPLIVTEGNYLLLEDEPWGALSDLLDEVWQDVPAALRPAATWTLAAHLDKLEEEGRLPGGVQRPDPPPPPRAT